MILAAGKGRRMGMPKSLLTWRGQTFIDHLIKSQYIAGITHIVVVTFDPNDRDGLLQTDAQGRHRDATLASTELTTYEAASKDAQDADTARTTPPISAATSYASATLAQASDLRIDTITAPATAPMLASLHAAIAHIAASLRSEEPDGPDRSSAPKPFPALLMGPIDQGPYPPELVASLLDGFAPRSDAIRVPTYRGQTGHPVLLGGGFVPSIPQDHDDGLRGYLQAHAELIEHIALPYEAIPRNLNTRAQYDAFLAANP